MGTQDDPEEWRAIPSLPDYEASSWGRVRRRPYEAPMPHGGVRTYGGVPWVGAWDKERGRYVIQYKRKTYRIAKLVCEAFHGPAPFAGANVLHEDERSANNRPSNLYWGTQKENLNAPEYLASISAARRGRPTSKLTPEQRAEIIRRGLAGEGGSALAREFDISACYVSTMLSKARGSQP